MNPWQQFLVEQGAQLEQASFSGVADFGAGLTLEAVSQGFVTPLTDLGLMALTGEDAAHFLHNQLTNDVQNLGLAQARLAAYCSPKGRMLASLLMWRSADVIHLQLPREIQGAIQKRLQMFVLRAKVKIADITDEQAMLGVGGQKAATILAQWFPQLPVAPYEKVDSAVGTLIRLADGFGAARYQWITTIDQAKALWPELTQSLRPVGTAWWRLADILAGVPQIRLATQEKFVPQMINFEIIGGVNFKKGCYPGQEIVARSQYLGKLKRRMVLATVDGTTAAAGMELISSADPQQPCGMVVNAERQSPQTMTILAELKLTAIDEGTIHLGSADGPALNLQPLPYALPDAA
jgi:folate-binding protein YgfZ